MNLEKFYLLRQAARVERMHTQPLARQQTVGEHTFGVLALLDLVYPEADTNMWRAVLYHDVPEAITGDVPATAKWNYPGMAKSLKGVEQGIEIKYDLLTVELSERDYAVLKYCDMMELAIFSIEEAERGDRNAIRVAYNCINFLKEQEYINSAAANLFDYVTSYLNRSFPSKGVLFNHE